MKLGTERAEIYIPGGAAIEEAFARTTHMGIAAHQDDLEIMAFHGILECFQRGDRGFFGVTVTNGGGSPRTGLYADYDDEQMQEIRRSEQKKAAAIGDFSGLALLGYPSEAVKSAGHGVSEDLGALIRGGRPSVIYTHNLADKHDTHVAVCMRVIETLRGLPADARPQQLLGCEVWRDLDWLPDEDKIALRVDGRDNLAAALLGVFDSQICGGKRYDLATLGRRRAHATYHASHEVDVTEGLTFAMDLTPLITDPEVDIARYVSGFIERLQDDVLGRLAKLR